MLWKTVTESVVFYQKQKLLMFFRYDLTARILLDNAMAVFCGCVSVRVKVACIFGSSKHGKAEEQSEYQS